MKPLTEEQRKYLEAVQASKEFSNSITIDYILRIGSYDDGQAVWLNKHSHIHARGTVYDKK